MKTVLWLSANPPKSGHLDLEDEVAKTMAQLDAAKLRDLVNFVHKPAVRAFDLVYSVSECKPQIVHFSGHGAHEGIMLRGEGDDYSLATTDWLKDLLSGRGVELVVLNSCFSLEQSTAIAGAVPCVIGTAHEVGDSAAIRFSQMFYRRLVDGEKIKDAARDARLLANFEAGGDVYNELGGDNLDQVLFDSASVSEKDKPAVTAPSGSARPDLSGAAKIWADKIAFLEESLGKANDPDQIFSINAKLEDARQKLKDLTENP